MRKIPLFHKEMTVFFNFFKKTATKRLLAYRYGARKGNLTFFENRSSNRWFLSLYDVKEETFFNFNLTIRSFHSLYGAKKIFHSIFGRNGGAWGVRAWKEKHSFFIINLANRYLLSLYGAGKESLTIFHFNLTNKRLLYRYEVKRKKL